MVILNTLEDPVVAGPELSYMDQWLLIETQLTVFMLVQAVPHKIQLALSVIMAPIQVLDR